MLSCAADEGCTAALTHHQSTMPYVTQHLKIRSQNSEILNSVKNFQGSNYEII
jgi:hypothetical protein